MDFKKFRTDTSLEDAGVWIEIGEGFAVKIGRLGNKRHSQCYREKTSPPGIRRAIEAGNLSVEESQRIQIETLAESIIYDWRGLQEDGKEIPFSIEKAKELLTVKDFRGLIHELAAEQSHFRAKEVATAKDTLKKSSAGS